MKIVFISDMDLRGSGYFIIASNLCSGLASLGHDVKAIGLSYKGEEHNFNFSLLPAENFRDVGAMYHNLYYLWKPDALVVALDIPAHKYFMRAFQDHPLPYIGITPLESGPLCMSWAMLLMSMTKVLMISQHATDACREKGVPADHLQVGIDTQSWRFPLPDEREAVRNIIGVDNDTFVILTVADNQERKNPSRALEIVAEFKKRVTDKFRYVMVTREHSPVGMEIRDYAMDLGINQQLDIYERGISFTQLWSLYAAADAFLLTSKAEGLGLPFLEAQAVGVPVIGTRAGAITEHVERGGGLLIDPEAHFIDMFGNGRRALASVDSGVECLRKVYEGGVDIEAGVKKARAYVESRTWDIPIQQLDSILKGLPHGKEAQEGKEASVAG